MNDQARTGKMILVTIILFTALAEMALLILSLEANKFKGSQISRILLTAWLLWQVWDGSGWARWVTSALFLIGSILGAVVLVNKQGIRFREEFPIPGFIFIGVAVCCLLISVALASPWVHAYQLSRRQSLFK